MNNNASPARRTFARIVLGAFGMLAVAGLVSTASAKMADPAPNAVQTSQQEAKQNLPREWRWQRPTVNLDGMIRSR